MAKQTAVTEAHSAHIEGLRASGLRNVSQILRSLRAAGLPLNYRTARRYLDEHPAKPAAVYQGLASPEASPDPTPPPPPPVPDDRAVRALLDAEELDLPALARHALELRAAVDEYRQLISHSPNAAKTWVQLSRRYEELVARLIELRPRPEAERDRLIGLGADAKDALLKRARAEAEPGEVEALRRRVDAQAAAITRLTDALADGGHRAAK